jgi:peptidoglycan lytic transglycosylase
MGQTAAQAENPEAPRRLSPKGIEAITCGRLRAVRYRRWLKSCARVFFVALAVFLILAPSCLAGSGVPDSSTGVAPGKTLKGKATYYPDQLNGHKTASGERFHQTAHTAASNVLPLGTRAKVTNVKTGKSTEVTVIDRGPALGHRKIDLTKKAAKDIGLTKKQGVAPVEIKVTSTPGGAGAAQGR